MLITSVETVDSSFERRGITDLFKLVSHLYLQAGAQSHAGKCSCLFPIKPSSAQGVFRRQSIHSSDASKQASKHRDVARPANVLTLWRVINQQRLVFSRSLVQVRVESLGGLGVVVTGVDNVLWVAVATVVLFGTLNVLLRLAG